MPTISPTAGQPIHAVADVASAPAGKQGVSADDISLVPEPAPTMVSEDAITQLACLFAQLDQQTRSSAKRDEAAQNVGRAKADAAEVQAMHDKADDIRSSGLVAGLTSIGVGVAQFGAGMASLRGSLDDVATKGTDAAAKAAEKGVEASRAAGITSNPRFYEAVFSASAKGMEASGKITDAQGKATEVGHDADAKVHTSASAAYDRASKAAHEDATAAQESLAKVMSWVKEMHAAQSGAQLTAASSVRG